MSFLCRIGRHQASSRSQLDLNDLQVKSFCKRCGAVMIRVGEKWQLQDESKAA